MVDERMLRNFFLNCVPEACVSDLRSCLYKNFYLFRIGGYKDNAWGYYTYFVSTNPMNLDVRWGHYVNFVHTAPTRSKQKENKKAPLWGASFCLMTWVAGLGIAPRLEDYEPSVQLYTTPHVFLKEPCYFNIFIHSFASPKE